ncbi:hypothetical protein O1L60_38600 [Streptomyces diastatochromogenes]|nr:hypothetical protein [Streptomyces diastatochromogenes]
MPSSASRSSTSPPGRPRISREAELEMLHAAVHAELVAHDHPGFSDKWENADRGADATRDLITESQQLMACPASITAAAGVVTAPHPVLLPLLVLAVLPQGLAGMKARASSTSRPAPWPPSAAPSATCAGTSRTRAPPTSSAPAPRPTSSSAATAPSAPGSTPSPTRPSTRAPGTRSSAPSPAASRPPPSGPPSACCSPPATCPPRPPEPPSSRCAPSAPPCAAWSATAPGSCAPASASTTGWSSSRRPAAAG